MEQQSNNPIKPQKQELLAPTQIDCKEFFLNNADEKLGNNLLFYRIQQKLSKTLQPGNFTISLSGKQKKEVKFVWLITNFSRINWGTYDPSNPKKEPLCRSLSGEIPDSGTEMRKTACGVCLDAKWHGRQKPPMCAEMFSQLCWDTEDNLPFIIGFKRTAISPLRKLKTYLQAETIRRKIKSPWLFAFKLKLTLLCVEEKGGYYLPVFDILEENKQEEMEMYMGYAKNLISTFVTIAPEEIASSEEEIQENSDTAQEEKTPF